MRVPALPVGREKEAMAFPPSCPLIWPGTTVRCRQGRAAARPICTVSHNLLCSRLAARC